MTCMAKEKKHSAAAGEQDKMPTPPQNHSRGRVPYAPCPQRMLRHLLTVATICGGGLPRMVEYPRKGEEGEREGARPGTSPVEHLVRSEVLAQS